MVPWLQQCSKNIKPFLQCSWVSSLYCWWLGADSWCFGYNNAPKTLNVFVSYWLMQQAQPQLCNALHYGQKWFEQRIVDQYCKIEMEWLHYICQNQTKLQGELYHGVQDAIQTGDLSNVGTPVILPATVTGSKQYMHKCLQDALTLTSRFHKPDLFITMTANPNWSEIQHQLPTGFSPQSHKICITGVLSSGRELPHLEHGFLNLFMLTPTLSLNLTQP